MASEKKNQYLDQETSFRGRYSKEVFQTLYFAYRSILGRISFFVSLGFFGRLLLLSNANLIGIWVDTYCTRIAAAAGQSAAEAHCRAVPGVFAGLGDVQFLRLLIGVTLGGFILTAFFRIRFSRLSAVAVSNMYDEVTLRTSRLPIQFFDTNPVGRIVTRFSSDYGNVFRLFGGPLAEFFNILFDLICMFILITVASPYFLPIIMFVGCLNYIVYRLNRDRLRVERRELSANRSPAISHFAETTQGASTIRIFGRQSTFMKRFSRLNDRYLVQRIRTSAKLSVFSLEMAALTAMMLLLTGLAGYYLAGHGLVSVGSIGVAFTFVVFSGTSIQMFFEWFAQFEEAMTGVERLNDYLRRNLEPGAKLPASREFPTDHPVYSANEEEELKRIKLVGARSASVAVENLWFRYAPELPYVLKGLDFHVRPGEKIGIVGRTGSGKTSFVQALFHLYPFERGRILIDGRGPDVGREDQLSGSVDIGLFRRNIALISQEPTLFRGTLRENLDLANMHGDERLRDALDRVGLTEWLKAQPKGLDSGIEERGRNLSAGERQLLCMARCILQDAPVVVMDEATSSVDPRSEEILVRATREFFSDRTQIIIAHRLSTLVHCDRILWLHKGEIRMFDRPEKILPEFQATQL
jgi:ABC-type multidrug transport system fused ATPase/permease subunit